MIRQTLVALLGFGVMATASAIEVKIPVAGSVNEDAPDVSVSDVSKALTPDSGKPGGDRPALTEKPAGKPATSSATDSAPRAADGNADLDLDGVRQRQYLQRVDQDGEIPDVPAEVMPKRTANRPSYTNDARITDKSVLVMEPGVNQIVPVAVDHLNRIVTPFGTPVITTMSDNATTDVNQNVVYIGTNDEQPVTAFITEKGDQSRAMSLTLVPQKIPPRELFLRLSDGYGSTPASNPNAKRWETSQPYVETLREAFREIALGDMPQGYSIGRMTRSVAVPECMQSGLSFDFSSGQVLTGHSLSILVGVASNTSSQPVEFKEAACGSWDVAAVAAWPVNVLEPGQKTEVFIARKVNIEKPRTSKRPSLIGR